MATRKQTATEKANAVTTTDEKTNALAVMNEDMFAADAGHGMETADAESFAIPFLAVLQKMSPQVDEDSPTRIEGAKAGMFFDNVSNKLMDGKVGIDIVPCAFRRVFIRWGAKSLGEGFKGELTVEEVERIRAAGEVKELDGKLYFPMPDGSINPDKSDRLSDTRNHYVLVVDPETGAYKEALLSLSSTQIKKSKQLMAALASVRIKTANGQMVQPATYANIVRVTTVPESNDKGTWHGVIFRPNGFVKTSDIYAAGKAFWEKVTSGAVQAKYESPEGAAEQAGQGF